MKYNIRFLCLIYALSFATFADEKPAYQSNYVGEEKRAIKSLSQDAINQLQQGKGWGLAKAAELNGMPGPSHILQMKDKISLTSEQEIKIKALFDEMKSNAIPLGLRLIELEKTLNDSFANRTITEINLKQQLAMIADVRQQLRYTHLVTHLKTPEILTAKQVELYNQLRGYGSGDPCKNIPAGHDAAMWKKHNDCE